jgi:hypothetical protein
MALTMGDGRDQESIDQFIGSLVIHHSAEESGEADKGALGGGFDSHDLSKAIGGASVAIILVIGVWIYLVRRSHKSKQVSSR